MVLISGNTFNNENGARPIAVANSQKDARKWLEEQGYVRDPAGNFIWTKITQASDLYTNLYARLSDIEHVAPTKPAKKKGKHE